MLFDDPLGLDVLSIDPDLLQYLNGIKSQSSRFFKIFWSAK